MQEKITFRKALDTDIVQIMELQTQIFHGEQQIPTEAIEGFLSKNPMCWCAVRNEQVIGTTAAWEENGVLHWGRFAVNAEYRGLHIGTQLAQLSFDDIFSQGYTEIYMEAREITVKIICKMGGQITGEATPFYAGTITPLTLKKEHYRHVLIS